MKIGCLWAVGALLLAALALVAFLAWQGKRGPRGNPQYVALGSSFAAGIGLGPGAPGSPLVCQRSVNSYPGQLARMRNLSLVDMTCSGATTTQVLNGGQVFQGPQIDAIGPDTELVTITSGGNDVRYVGDLGVLAARNGSGFMGWAARQMLSEPVPDAVRDYAKGRETLVAALREIRRRAPRARIVVVSYPSILPQTGTCARLSLDSGHVATMRAVGDRLAAETRSAAAAAGALFVDMHRSGAAHNACSDTPWVNGWKDADGTQFHPTLAGAKATAEMVSRALDAR